MPEELTPGQICKAAGCGRRIRIGGLCFGHSRRGPDSPIAPRHKAASRDEAGRKRCFACTEWLPLETFTKDKRAPDGLRNICLECHRLRRRLYHFGISPDWFDTTFEAQGKCCAICQSPDPRGRGWAIDHDHRCCPGKSGSCGQCVRGILCSPCNLALGLMGDNVEVLASAADYIKRHARAPLSIVRGV